MNKEIFRLAIPNIISNVTVPMLGLVDLAILGHLGNAKYIGALALGSLIFNFIYWNFAFIRMGSSGMTAQAFGAKNKPEITKLLFRSALVCGVGGILLITLQKPIAALAFTVINGSEQVEHLARVYFSIGILAAPATVGLYGLTGWFIGMQNSITPMFIAITINVTNVILNAILVWGFGFDIVGVAYGTVISQYFGLAIAIYFIFKRYREYIVDVKLKEILNFTEMKRFFVINGDIFLRTFCVIIVMTFFTSRSAIQNDTILAINTILLQYFLMYSYMIDGFAFAAEALVGKYKGAHDKERLQMVVTKLFKIGTLVSILIFLLFFFLNTHIIALLTNVNAVITESSHYIYWIIFIPIVSVFAFIWDGIYIGATATKHMRNSLFFAALVFFTLYLATRNSLENHGLWLAFYGYMITRGVYQTIFRKHALKV